MDIDEYIWRNRISCRQFARDLDMGSAALNRLKNFKQYPTLATALKVVKHTKGEITIRELIHPDDRAQYEFKNKETTN